MLAGMISALADGASFWQNKANSAWRRSLRATSERMAAPVRTIRVSSSLHRADDCDRDQRPQGPQAIDKFRGVGLAA